MGKIIEKQGKRGPYFMTSVEGVVYASSDVKDVEAFLRGEEVSQVQSGDTWFWITRRSDRKGSEESAPVDKKVLKAKIHELVEQL